ncbi:hypothetical protein C8R46DRAFT_1233005 [Mycena filopes]|nr:hypothetical protein C8R46DRAFT_1233005 [Mycena filopes]
MHADAPHTYTDDEFATLIESLGHDTASTARAYSDEEFNDLISTLGATSPVADTPSSVTGAAGDDAADDDNGQLDQLFAALTLTDAPSTPPPYPAATRNIYHYHTPRARATAGTATQGVPGARVRAIARPLTRPSRSKKPGGYAVFFGRVPGPYRTWAKVEPLVSRVKSAIFRGYRTFDQAQAAYTFALAKSWIRTSRTTRPTPMHGDDALDDVWYIVYRGVRPGVYHSLLEALLNTVGVSNALHESVEGLQSALAMYTRAQQQQQKPGGAASRRSITDAAPPRRGFHFAHSQNGATAQQPGPRRQLSGKTSRNDPGEGHFETRKPRALAKSCPSDLTAKAVRPHPVSRPLARTLRAHHCPFPPLPRLLRAHRRSFPPPPPAPIFATHTCVLSQPPAYRHTRPRAASRPSSSRASLTSTALI